MMEVPVRDQPNPHDFSGGSIQFALTMADFAADQSIRFRPSAILSFGATSMFFGAAYCAAFSALSEVGLGSKPVNLKVSRYHLLFLESGNAVSLRTDKIPNGGGVRRPQRVPKRRP
jgi:hypothetical protein